MTAPREKFKVVDSTTPPSTPERDFFLAQCLAMVEQLVILGATTMVFMADIKDELEIRSVPRSACLEVGVLVNATMQYPVLSEPRDVE